MTALLASLLVVAGAVATSAASGAPVAGGVPAGAAPTVPAGRTAGSAAVQLSADAAAHPQAVVVAAQLQRYFDAINTGDYGTWQTTVVPERAKDLTADKWKLAYRSTRDGTIRIDRIDDAADRLLVRVRFVSTQDVADAPADLQEERICWWSTLPMTGSPPRIAVTRGGSSAREAC